MSHNQGRADRTDSSQNKKSGRSNRNYSGGGSKGTSGSGGGAPAPHPGNTHHHHSSNQPSLSSNRSFKKHGGNVQGGGPRGQHVQVVNPDSGTAPAALRAVQNGAHPPPQQLSQGGLNANVAAIRQQDVVAPRTSRAPRVPSSNVPPVAISDPKNSPATATPVKAEASHSYTLQFGSISPGLMNGMQIPARTSSAPPNLDEQKRDQARHDSFRTPPNMPYPSAPRQQLPKDVSPADQPSASEGHPAAKPKRDIQVSVAPPVQTQKPSMHQIPSVPMAFHQSHIPVQFGGPNPQIQSQAMSATTLTMPMPMHMPLQIGNPSVQQQVFVPALPHHHMQQQGILHQGQNLSFPTQMGPPIPPQVGNIGMNMAPQYPQQQSGKYGGPRKAVKITHPETHEELRLDGSVTPRSHPNVPPQSQPTSSFSPAHTSNYYPGSYNAFFQATSSLTHPIPQPHRHHNQVTVKQPATSSQGERDAASVVSSSVASKGVSQKILKPPQRDMEPSSQSLKHSKPGVGPASAAMSETSKFAGLTGSESGPGPILVPNSVPPPSPLVAVEKPSRGPSIAEGSLSERSGMLAPAQDKQVKDDGRVANASVSASQVQEIIGTTLSSGSNVVIENPSKKAAVLTLAEPSVVDLKLEDKKISEPSKGTLVTAKGGDGAIPEISGEKNEVASMLHSKIDDISLVPSASEPDKIIGTTVSSALKGTKAEAVETLPRQLEESSAPENDEGNVGNQGSGEAELESLISKATAQNDEVASVSTSDRIDTVVDSVVTGFSTSEKETPDLVPSSEENVEHDQSVAVINAGDTSAQMSGTKEKLVLEPNVSKTTGTRGKKKRKELLRKLDNSGPTSDLYLAYKGPEEKKEESAISAEMPQSSNDSEQPTSDVSKIEITEEEAGQSKVEPDDWEDAADTPKLETSADGMQGGLSAEDSNGVTIKKYSRDFLLTFSEHFTELPEGFEMVPEINEVLVVSNIGVSRDQYSGSGRVDRPRLDRRGSNLNEEEKWNKVPGPIMTGRDMRMDMNYSPNMGMFRPGQVPNHGVLRNPRMQQPLNYPGSMHLGQMQMGPQIGVPRNNPDSERWQRGTNFQKGLMPSPQTPLAVMHKAERKYEIGKVTDEEQAKQRQLKGILNKLTPQNFERLFEQVQNVNIDNVITLSGVISQIFDKALMEPTFCEMYATFCQHLAAELPELTINDERVTFKRLLLNKCQEEFERGEKEQAEANKVDEKGEAELSAEVREEKRLQARRRMLGNIRLIGELYKKKMLTERIMHECIRKLLGEDSKFQNQDEEDLESLCKLMSTIGGMIDHQKAKGYMDIYFEHMERLSNEKNLSSRVRFMLKDSIDLRKNKWQQRRKVEGPKKIDEVHRDAAQERQAQARGLSRTPSMGSSVRRGQPSDFSPRGSNHLASPSSHMGGLRPRGFGGQDARMEERTVPLPNRSLGEEAPFLGPQGGLGLKMSSRGQAASQIPDRPSSGESRRMVPGLNGYPTSERTVHSSREDHTQRYIPERSVGPFAHDQSSIQERNSHHGIRDGRGIDRSRPLTPPTRIVGVPIQSATSDKALSEDRLRELSMSAIKEFYSAKDENEVALCIKDLNSPSFHPTMISLWVTDSFERKDMERDHLTKLLIALTKNGDESISQDQLIKGFGFTLMSLEDAVNDAPKAAEYLGRMFAKTVLESVAPLNEIERIILEGGEEPGRLVEIGLAAEVLGTTLEIIAAESDSVLKELLSGSNIKLEMFRPPGLNKAWRLDKFI